MKKQMIIALMGVLTACLILLTAFRPKSNGFSEAHPGTLDSSKLLTTEEYNKLEKWLFTPKIF